MKTDQFDYTDDDVILARCVSMLVERLYDKDGNPVDIADEKGRESLIRSIKSLPSEVSKRNEELLKKYEEILDKKNQELIKQYEENQKLIKSWFWWIVAVVGIAFILLSLFFINPK